MSQNVDTLPNAFIFRRLHSLTGFWLVLFLMEHLFVNSQAALFIGDDGSGFVRAVNGIRNLPYLSVIELFLLGMPIAVHAIWGIQYALTSQENAHSTNGSKPSLWFYARNQAFSWQRITSWILLVGIIAHVVQMRFLEYPAFTRHGTTSTYAVKVSNDKGLKPLSERLEFNILSPEEAKQSYPQYNLKTHEVILTSNNFGTAELMMVRDTFKSPFMIVLYTIFVLTAVFHAFNGLWSFMISWGITLNQNSQRYMRWFANGLMALIAFLGLAATWGTYWINLKQ